MFPPEVAVHALQVPHKPAPVAEGGGEHAGAEPLPLARERGEVGRRGRRKGDVLVLAVRQPPVRQAHRRQQRRANVVRVAAACIRSPFSRLVSPKFVCALSLLYISDSFELQGGYTCC